MHLNNFTNEQISSAIKIHSGSINWPYNEADTIEPIVINNIQRTDDEIIVQATQKQYIYTYFKTYRFSNENNMIKAEVFDATFPSDGYLDYSKSFIPIFKMLSSDDKIKGNDWLSRFSYNELLEFANKYKRPCASINIYSDTTSNHHLRHIDLKDENDYYLDSWHIGDYGFCYNNHHLRLSNYLYQKPFTDVDIEFFKAMISKLKNKDDILIYTKNFIEEHKSAFIRDNSHFPNFEEELKNSENIQKQLSNIANKKIKSFSESEQNTQEKAF